MGGQGREVGGLVLALLGVLGVCVACGMPVWRETSFVGANIVNAQTVWDGLWLHCVIQSTGQMQCKKHVSPISMTTDLKASRALTLIAILAGLIGAIIALLGGRVTNCNRRQPEEPFTSGQLPSSKNKASILGGALCILAGVLCLIAASWSAANTIYIFNDPLLATALKREVGSSVYVGWVSSFLLLLGGGLLCCVCTTERNYYNSYPAYTPYSSDFSSPRGYTPSDRSEPRNQRYSGGRKDSRGRPSLGSIYHSPPNLAGKLDPSMSTYTGAQRPGGLLEYNPPSRAETVAGVYYHNPASVVSTGHLPPKGSF